MRPTYDLIVVDLSRVHKHNVYYEQVPVGGVVLAAEVVRIVDKACSPPQLTDKGVTDRYIPAGDEDNP